MKFLFTINKWKIAKRADIYRVCSLYYLVRFGCSQEYLKEFLSKQSGGQSVLCEVEQNSIGLYDGIIDIEQVNNSGVLYFDGLRWWPHTVVLTIKTLHDFLPIICNWKKEGF